MPLLPAEELKPTHLLNQAQQIRLRVTCNYIDKLLSDVESILHAASSKSPFSKYVADINPAQASLLEEQMQAMRRQLVRSLAWQGMEEQVPRIAATHGVLTIFNFLDVAAEELRPRYMRGSGAITTTASEGLTGVAHELHALLRNMRETLLQDVGRPLEERLAEMDDTEGPVMLLQSLAAVLARHGLIEFRSRLQMLLARLEEHDYEIAVFGRVSAGKSSLLNALLGTDVLPVGVNPITAVPTRLRAGPAATVTLTHPNGETDQVPLTELHRYVTEAENPGNRLGITRVLAELPSTLLPDNVVLVDTPGLGSLARNGTRETLAYLPSADLALLLVDSSGTLNEEDIGTLRQLFRGGIPAIILLSKADLLSEQEISSSLAYVREQLGRYLGDPVSSRLQIEAVSSRRTHASLLKDFVQNVLLPRFQQAQALSTGSVTRKAYALRDEVVASLEAAFARTAGNARSQTLPLEGLETRIRIILGEVGELPRLLAPDIVRLEESRDDILKALANRLASASGGEGGITEWIEEAVQAEWQPALQRIQETSANALAALSEIGEQLGSAGLPTRDEVESLTRDLPRFEFSSLMMAKLRDYKFLGRNFALRRLRAQLSQAIGAPLQQQLRAYGRALNDWSRQVSHELERLVSSYADGFRAQVLRLAGHSEQPFDPAFLQQDIALLRAMTPDDASL